MYFIVCITLYDLHCVDYMICITYVLFMICIYIFKHVYVCIRVAIYYIIKARPRARNTTQRHVECHGRLKYQLPICRNRYSILLPEVSINAELHRNRFHNANNYHRLIKAHLGYIQSQRPNNTSPPSERIETNRNNSSSSRIRQK